MTINGTETRKKDNMLNVFFNSIIIFIFCVATNNAVRESRLNGEDERKVSFFSDFLKPSYLLFVFH